MLAIFFPHLFEDAEYLVPPEELSIETAASQEEPTPAGGSGSSFQNAVAGPSRLQ